MNKLGLLIELIGFIMLFISSKWTTGGDIEHEILTNYLFWIADERTKEWISRNWERIAFILVTAGVFLQFGSC
jgi:hypothetical protein